MIIEEAEKTIGYKFKNRQLLVTAFTHSSYANDKHTESYERLEFLGDAILDFVAGEKLFIDNPVFHEGDMTRRRADMVCEKALYEAACRLDFGRFLYLSHGEEMTGGRNRVSVLADTIESVTAAIYLDSGFDEAKSFLLRNVITGEIHAEKNTKSALLEKVQKDGITDIKYEKISESGPDHDKTFVVQVLINGKVFGKGTGKSKQEAQKRAAAEALEVYGK